MTRGHWSRWYALFFGRAGSPAPPAFTRSKRLSDRVLTLGASQKNRSERKDGTYLGAADVRLCGSSDEANVEASTESGPIRANVAERQPEGAEPVAGKYTPWGRVAAETGPTQ